MDESESERVGLRRSGCGKSVERSLANEWFFKLQREESRASERERERNTQREREESLR